MINVCTYVSNSPLFCNVNAVEPVKEHYNNAVQCSMYIHTPHTGTHSGNFICSINVPLLIFVYSNLVI